MDVALIFFLFLILQTVDFHLQGCRYSASEQVGIGLSSIFMKQFYEAEGWKIGEDRDVSAWFHVLTQK